MSRVTVTNPFDLLTDENEDRTNVPAPKKEQKPAAPAAKPAAKPAATGVAAKPVAPKAEGAKAPAKTDAKAAPKPAGNSAANVAKPAPIRDSNQNLQERDKESRAPRDKRDYRPPHVGGDSKKRVNDRKSGTGRGPNDVKKSGQGKHNWGGDVAEVEALKDEKEKNPEDTELGEPKNEEKVTVEGGEKKEGGETKEETPAQPAEPETFTFEEYLAKQKSKAIVGLEALKPRTVNAEDFGAAGLVPLQRGEQGSAPLQAKDKKEKKEKPAAEKTEKPAGEKKEKTENLAAQLLHFASHQETQRRDKPFRNYDNNRQQGGERRAPRNYNNNNNNNNNSNSNNRAPRNNAAQDASRPPVQEKDFPTLKSEVKA